MMEFIALHGLASIVIGLVALLCVYFLLYYVFPAMKLGRELSLSLKQLQRVQETVAHQGVTPIEEAETAFLHSKPLAFAWREYKNTIHQQYVMHQGQRQLSSLRATAPAEAFFNTTVLVDTRLNTEFFKHLPGILTGIGIIGTFAGLLLALPGLLDALNNLSDISGLQPGLVTLVSGVQEAFIASGVAIGMAMVITFIEKLQLNRRYKQTERLAQGVDALYRTGAGEEYLREVVETLEQSRDHTAELKQAMVYDLKVLLTDLSGQMVEGFELAMGQQTERLIAQQKYTNQLLVEAIQEGMKDPLNKMEQSIAKLTAKQEEGVSELINFAVERIGLMFGERLNEFGVLLQSATDQLDHIRGAMDHTAERFTQAGNSMGLAGEKMQFAGVALESAGEETARKILEAGSSLDQTTQRLASAQDQVVNNLTYLVTQAENAAGQLLGVEQAFAQLKELIENLQVSATQAITQYQMGADTIANLVVPLNYAADHMKDVSKDMNQDISTLLSQVMLLTHQVTNSMKVMEQTVIHGAERMNSAGDHIKLSADDAAGKLSLASGTLVQSMETSAESIEKASDYFFRNSNNSAQVMSDSIEEVSGLLASIKPISDNMVTSGRHLIEMTGNLDHAADKMNIWVTDYDRHRILLEGLMRQITDTVHQSDTRNDLGRRQVEQMQQLVAQMRTAQQEAARFGQQVSSVMSRSYDEFTTAMIQSMQTISSQHQANLTASLRSIAQQFELLDQRLKQVSDNALIRADQGMS
jgi:hypothetical protein